MNDGGDNWMGGYAPAPPARPAAPVARPVIAPAVRREQSQPAAGWKPGDCRRLVDEPCCPACGSIEVRRRDNGRDPSTERWECLDCGNSQRHPAGFGPIVR